MHPDVYRRPLFLLLLALIVGLLLWYKPAVSPSDILHFTPKQQATLIGRVERFYTAKPKSNNVIVKVLSVDGKPASGYAYARLTNFEPLWKDTLEITGKLQEPYGINLLGNFNWRRHLSYKHVFTEIKSEQVVVQKPACWFFRILRFIRNDILHVFSEHFPSELANIAGGVLLGERGELSPELFTAFQDSGAIHLLVASGGNVGFVTLMTLAVCGLFGLTRRKALWVALLVAGVYTLIAGTDAPLMRAYFMTVCACGGYYLGRNSGVLQGLILSCVIILILYPSSLFETGFQMSFIATAALIICLQNYPIPSRWPRWARFFAQIFMATLAVQLALLPIFTNVFYKVSLTGLIANMILVPLASILLGLSFAYYICCVCHIGIVLYYPTIWCLELFRYLVEFFATAPFSAISVTAWGTGSIVSYYAILFWILHIRIALIRKWFGIAAVLIVCIACGVQTAYRHQSRVYLLDEWYKSVAVVQMKDGNIFVVGDGLEPEKVKNALYRLGSKQATAAFLTRSSFSKNNYQALSMQIIEPFTQGWPQIASWTFGDTKVRMIWGMRTTKTGGIWYNTGYSGSKNDEVSYCFSNSAEPEFCIGAEARFVQVGQRLIPAQVNTTVSTRIKERP